MDISVYQNIWFFIIGFLLTVYSILDGFDLGIASLMPALAKNEKEQKQVMDSIWPVWDGNEVWLITGGAALFAAFPFAYATVFSGFYLALMLVLFALIFRAVSMEFWYYDEKRRKLWAWAFTIGSFLPSLLFGVALGNIIYGIPIDLNMNFTGSFFTLLRPFPLVIGLLGLSAILLQGCTWAAYKIEGDVARRAKALMNKLIIANAFLFILAIALTIGFLPSIVSNLSGWLGALVYAISLSYVYVCNRDNRSFNAFMGSSVSFVSLWIMAGAALYPNLVRSTIEAYNLTIFNASSTQLTLKIMFIIALIGMPVVLAYTIYVYKVFKGKVS
ncbi:MAG TPA: cytochrome d ubiquinol oxidase subunit II [Spirochaetota bacterium]|nr:cytochrome d ubiquinol oxidase subunit II [Spirochaetota bacterium]HOM09387.1 cytochrome d ubiquinol oxidase subunit II [Spirochaetota bacterium]HPP49242.1 cytochrome d ubiquinol oxidase subunit II [Spirochaetota bacterium]